MLDLNRVDDQVMEVLYELSRQALQMKIHKSKHNMQSWRWKIMACLFKVNSIHSSLERFQDYDIDVEVCQSIYQREYSAWTRKIEVWGALPS